MPESIARTYIQLLQEDEPRAPLSDAEHEDLRYLEALGFVIDDPVSDRVKRYYPLASSIVAPSIRYMFEWKFAADSEEHTAGELDRLCELISRTAGEDRPRPLPSSLTYLEGRTGISNFLASIIPKATDLLCVSAATWATNLPLIWAALRKRLEEGLHYRRIASLDSFIAFGYEINKRDIRELGIDLRLVHQTSLSPVVYVIDTAEARSVLLFNDMQMRSVGRQEATFVTHPALVMRLADAAEDLWSTAVGGPELLERIPAIRQDFLSNVVRKLGNKFLQAAEAAFDYGVFAERSIAPPETMQILAETGFLVESSVSTLGISRYQVNIANDLNSILDQLKEERGNGTSG